MAVAMAGRAIKPSLDVLQQLVKSQRENVAEIIEQEQRQIDQLKSSLDESVRENEDIEHECLQMESKVELVLSNPPLTPCRFAAPTPPAATAEAASDGGGGRGGSAGEGGVGLSLGGGNGGGDGDGGGGECGGGAGGRQGQQAS